MADITKALQIAFVASLVSLLFAFEARSQVDCDTPDDLCTGDPCVIGTVIVAPTCTLDFGARTVVIAGRLRILADGALSLTAGEIRIDGTVENLRPTGTPAGGPQISLAATGDIELGGRIRLLGSSPSALLPGAVSLAAGEDLILDGSLTATTSPTTLAFDAGTGDVVFRGRVNTSRAGGAVTFSAGSAVTLRGSLRQLEDITVDAGTAVDLGGSLTPRESLTVDAGGTVTLDTPIRSFGAEVALRGDAGVAIKKLVYLSPVFELEGSLEIVSAFGPVSIASPLRSIETSIDAGGDIVIGSVVSANSPARSGGTIRMSSGGDVIVSDRLRAQSGDGTQPGDGAGGHIEIDAAGLVQITADVLVTAFPGRDGAPGGTLDIEAGQIVLSDLRFDADGDAPGPDFPGSPPAGFQLRSTSGNISLDGVFDARGGPSVMEAVAAANLVATGQFSADPDGCIALAATGTVNASGGDFDPPFVSDCP